MADLLSNNEKLCHVKETDVWKILIKNVDSIPEALINCELTDKKRRYQLFELLITHLIATLLPSYKWVVTPVQGDLGVDFWGEFELFDFPEFDLNARYYIFGQCKIKSNSSDIIGDFATEIIKMHRQENRPNLIIVAIAADVTEKVKIKEKKSLENEFKSHFSIMSKKEIEPLFGKYFNYIEPIIKFFLEEQSCELLKIYFQKKSEVYTDNLPVHIFLPRRGETGVPFEVKVKIEPTVHMEDDLSFFWIWPTSDDFQNYHLSPLELRVPHSMIYPKSLKIQNRKDLPITKILKFQGHSPGIQKLGQVIIKSEQKTIKEIDLGEIYLAEQYHPKFFRKPFEGELQKFSELIDQTKDNGISTVGVIGSGGSGKTRLCEAFGTLAENEGFKWISISHPNHLERPYKVLADLILNLSPLNFDNPEIILQIQNYISRINKKLYNESKETLNILFSEEMMSIISGTFNTEIIIQLLLTIILEQNSLIPLCIHLCDLHWGTGVVFKMFLEIIERLKIINIDKLKGIVFIFEGRVSEIQQHIGKVNEEVIVEWENFVSNRLDHLIKIFPLNYIESEEFLQNLFELSQSPNRKIPKDLIVDQEILIENILKYAEGNPFHMIEQVKLLKYSGTIRQNPRNGLLFLSKSLKKEYEVPKDVHGLIINRFRYLEKYNLKLSKLIRAIALIKDRIEMSLYLDLKNSIAKNISIEDIEKTEFLIFPITKFGEVRFRHENYYQTIKKIEINKKEKIVKCYLNWIQKKNLNSADILFDYGTILEQEIDEDKAKIKEIFLKSHKIAEKNHQYQISTNALEKILALFPSSREGLARMNSLEIIEYIKYLMVLGKQLSWTVDWEKTKRTYKRIIELILYFKQNFIRITARDTLEKIEIELYSAKIELANVEKQLMNSGSAIELLNNLIPPLKDIYKNHSKESSKSEWASLTLRALNRLGVTYWFNGHHEEGFLLLRDALHFSKELKDTAHHSDQLRDFGTIYVHKNPKQAMKILKKGISLITDHSKHPKQYYLLQYQMIIAELVFEFNVLKKENNKNSLLKKIDLLTKIFIEARKQGFANEQGGSSLILGVCYALLNSKDAIRWLTTSISLSRRFALYEFLWKAHINLAQFCTTKQINEQEAATFHAFQALKIIEDDLMTKKGIYHNKRYNFFTLPLKQIHRIFCKFDIKNAKIMEEKYPELGGKLCLEDTIVLEFGSKPLFIINHSNRYFLMN